MKITVQTVISVAKKKVWDYYTKPEHITKWNFALDSWQCPSASNDMKVGGKYTARMEAKDGSFGFDFEAIYKEVVDRERFTYTMPDNRVVNARFKEVDGQTESKIVFDAERKSC